MKLVSKDTENIQQRTISLNSNKLASSISRDESSKFNELILIGMFVKFFLYIAPFLYIFGNSVTLKIILKEDIAEVEV